MAAYAVLVSLMNNIEQIQRHTRLPIRYDKKQSESLLEKVNFLIGFLESYNYHAAGEEMEDLESRITDIAYAAEDIIETYVVDRIKGENIIMALLRWICPRKKNITAISSLPGIEKVMQDMDLIKEETMKIKDKSGIDGLLTMYPTNASSSSSILVGKNDMVGFDHELNELLERLTGNERNRQIIPIVGMGGIGKTTLAKTAYEKPLILRYFDYCAWVSISQEYSSRQIFLRLLGNEFSKMSDVQLGGTLYKRLCGIRYLVVLDDMWSVEAWEKVKVFFPEYNNGSRIIVTTRISSLAPYFGWCNLEMNFLDEDKGWDLFCQKSFGQEGCPQELEEVGRKIVKKCQGLPLSIVVIGGLLANSERTSKSWEYIARDTNAIVSIEGEELCMKILYFSYRNLPVHLKPCFLYMGVIPEDEIIHVSMLIKLWVAEGFVKPNSSKELDIVAKEYLNDLISRNLIIVHGHGHRGRINRCMIHDLLRHLCLKEAHKGKFLYVPKMHGMDEVQRIGSQRHIIIPTPSHIPKHLGSRNRGFLGRSLTSHMALPLKNFRYLRVLQGSKMHFRVLGNVADYLLDDIFKLVNLRFIIISCSTRSQIPSSISLLWNLQILIVRGTTWKVIAPLEIWEMVELRHFQFDWGLHLPDPPLCHQMNGQEDYAIMKKLYTLKGIHDFRLSDELVKRIPNVKTMKIYYELAGKELEEMCLNRLCLLENLESLSLTFKYQPGPDLLSNLTFPNSLKKLSLNRCGLHGEDMTMIASLPHLEVLKLWHNAIVGPEWVLDEERFRCLKYLQIYYCCNLVRWIADDTHFPCLEHLHLEWLDELVEIPSGIGDIPTLQMIDLRICSKSVVISAKKILEEQEDLGNASLQIRVRCDKDPELESLASDNFIIKSL